MPLTRTGKETFKDSENKVKKKSHKKQFANSPVTIINNDMSIHLNYNRLTRRPMRNENKFEMTEDYDDDNDDNDDNDVEKDDDTPTDSDVESSIFSKPLYIMIISLLLVLIVIVIAVFSHPTPDSDVVIPGKPDMNLVSELESCIYILSRVFPKQDSDLWGRMVKNFIYNSEHKQSVMCQTLTTHSSNLQTVNCLVRKLANCLGESVPYTFTPSKKFDTSASILEKELNYSSISVGYFEKITDYLFPLPFIFQSICDPDHSPYKKKTFYFSIITDDEQIDPQTITHKYLSKLITEILIESWVTDGSISLSEEETMAIISRISETSYYIRQEDENITC